MAAINPKEVGGSNVLYFLDMIAVSEIGETMLSMPETDNGYRVLVGSLPNRLSLFDSYDDHPLIGKKAIHISGSLYSSAAGRYQILTRYWNHYKKQLELPDFGPISQDRYAIQQIREQRALDDVRKGRIPTAIKKCSNIWASFSGAGYGQNEHSVEHLVNVYRKVGGKLA